MAKKRIKVTEATIRGFYYVLNNAPCIITKHGKDFAMLTLIEDLDMMNTKKGSNLKSHESSQQLYSENEKEEYHQEEKYYRKKTQRVPKQGTGFEICQKCFNAQGTEIIEEEGIEYHVCQKCLDKFKNQII